MNGADGEPGPIGPVGPTGPTGPAGGGGGTFTEVEIDWLGNTAGLLIKKFTVTDAGVSSSSKIIPAMSHNAATGRAEDENEFASFVFSAFLRT